MKTIHQISAGGIVFKKNNDHYQWLICQHSQHKGWVFPKGLVGDHDSKESKEKAALREVKEEGGVEAKIVYPFPLTTFYQYRWQNQLIKKRVDYFIMEYVAGDTKDHDWEMSQAKFIDQDQVLNILTYSSDKKVFKKVLDIFKKL